MPGSAQIGNLAVNLSLETGAFTRGAKQAEAQARGLKGTMAGLSGTMKGFAAGMVGGLGVGLVTTGLASVASGAFEMAAGLAEASDKVGVTVEALQELRLAATQNGISNENLDTSLTRMNKTLGNLQLGASSAVTAYERIGLSADELKGKTPDEALRMIADGLNKIPEASVRAAVGQEIFGRGFATMLPLINGGSKALDEWAAKSEKNGQITTEDAKKLDELADSWDEMKTRVLVATANVLAAVARFAGGVTDMVEKWFTFKAAVIQAARESVAAVTKMVAGIGNALTGRLSGILNNAKARVEEVRQVFANLYDKVVGNSYVPDMVLGIQEWMGKLDSVMTQPAVKATKESAEAFERMGSLIDRLFPEDRKAREYADDLAFVEKWAVKLGMSTAQAAAATQRLIYEMSGVDFNAPAQVDIDTSGYRSGIEDVPEIGDLVDKLPGMTAQVNELGVAFSSIASRGVSDFADGLTDVVTGSAKLKDVFGNLAKSIIRDIVAMSLKMLVFRGLAAAFPSVFGQMGNVQLPQFASGGSGVFGGLGGLDRNVLSLNGSPIARVSKGEHFSVTPANSNGPITVHQTISPNFAGNAATQEDLQRMALLTKTATIQAVREERRRA